MKLRDIELYTIRGTKFHIIESESGLGIGGVMIDGVGAEKGARMSLCAGKELLENVNIPNDLRDKINLDFIYDVIILDKKGTIILDEDSCFRLRAFNKAQHDERIQNARNVLTQKQAEQEQKYPGITELRKAYDDWYSYHVEFERMMDDEDNDGVNPPKRPTSNIDELKAKYPLAALYLKADDYCDAANYHKAAAGKKAKAWLDNGGDMECAQQILDNWLPAESIWD